MDDTYLSRRHYDGVPAVKTDAVTWPDGIVREIVRAERGYSKSIHAAVRKGLVLELRVLVENGHGTSGVPAVIIATALTRPARPARSQPGRRVHAHSRSLAIR